VGEEVKDCENDDNEYCYYEPRVSFWGCNCDHYPDEHGWGSCDVDDCECGGGWEE
jgi:hypothetical protein